MIYGLVIGYINEELETRLKYLDTFVQIIDNWAICDCCCSTYKFTNKSLKEMWKYLQKYKDSQNEFEVRFLCIMLMDYYLIDEYIDSVLEIYENIKLDKYYVKMGIAWGISVAFVKSKNKVIEFLKNNRLDDFTYNKAIQKMIESNRIDKITKDELRKMKRRKKQVKNAKKVLKMLNIYVILIYVKNTHTSQFKEECLFYSILNLLKNKSF